jgi:uracil-DNA glycosylase
MACIANSDHLGCRACSLRDRRVIPGHGDPNATIAIVGEAPGAQEEQQGIPFVGPAGALLDRCLGQVGLDRQRIWITNAVHCRPPRNDIKAVPDAVAKCPTLWLFPRELDQLPNLRVIVACGATSGSIFFPGKKATELAKFAVRVRGRIVIGAVHPAFALPNRGGAWAEALLMRSLERAALYDYLS